MKFGFAVHMLTMELPIRHQHDSDLHGDHLDQLRGSW
jgi:hypothetical protein